MPRVSEDMDMSNYSYHTQAAVAAPETRFYGREFTQALQRLTAQVFTTLRMARARASASPALGAR